MLAQEKKDAAAPSDFSVVKSRTNSLANIPKIVSAVKAETEQQTRADRVPSAPGPPLPPKKAAWMLKLDTPPTPASLAKKPSSSFSPANSAFAASADATTFTQDHLVSMNLRKKYHSNIVDLKKLETYLRDEDFKPTFGVSRADFGKMPGWKQIQKRKDANLF